MEGWFSLRCIIRFIRGDEILHLHACHVALNFLYDSNAPGAIQPSPSIFASAGHTSNPRGLYKCLHPFIHMICFSFMRHFTPGSSLSVSPRGVAFCHFLTLFKTEVHSRWYCSGALHFNHRCAQAPVIVVKGPGNVAPCVPCTALYVAALYPTLTLGLSQTPLVSRALNGLSA